MMASAGVGETEVLGCTILPKFDSLSAQNGAKQPTKTTVVYVPNNTAHAIGKALCRYAKEHNAEKLVLERTSKNFLSNIFLGSVASYVASHSPVPLVIVGKSQES